MIPDIAKRFPETIWAGRMVFFAFVDRMARAILSDVSDKPILAYQAVKTRWKI